MSLGLDSLGTASLGLGGELPRTEYGFLLFDFEPNAQGFMQEVLTWQTQVLEAQDGTEQRQGYRARPRRWFNYSTVAEGQRAFTLENIVYGSNNQTYAVPVWTDATTLTAPANNAIELSLDYAERGFWQGGYLLIYQSPTLFEFARVASFGAGVINLTEGTFYEWPAGTLVYPIVFATLAMPTRLDWFTGNTLTANITLEILPTESNDYLPVESAPVTYQGLEVLTEQPNWSGNMDHELRGDYLSIDSGVGLFERLYLTKHTRLVRSFKWWLHGRQALHNFRAFLQRRKGQLVPFWAVREVLDLPLLNSLSATDVTLLLQGTHHAFYTGLNKGREHLAIALHNGTTLYREVTAVSATAGNTSLTLNANLGQSVSPAQVASIRWLQRYRLAADQVTIPWDAVDFAEPELVMVSLV